MECWSVKVTVQGSRHKVYGTEVKRLSQKKSRIPMKNGVAVNRVPSNVSHLFQVLQGSIPPGPYRFEQDQGFLGSLDP